MRPRQELGVLRDMVTLKLMENYKNLSGESGGDIEELILCKMCLKTSDAIVRRFKI